VTHWKKRHKKLLINRILIQPAIMKLVKQQKPTLIFTREPFILNKLVQLGIPVIFESHNNKLHNRIKIVHRFIKHRVIKASRSLNLACLFSISDALAKFWITEGVPEEKSFSYHDGFDHSLFEEHQEKYEARELLDLPRGKTIVTYTGGLYPDREIDNIISLAGIFPEILFLVIGGPEKNRRHYLDIAEKISVKNIHFMGFIKHASIPQYLFASDILLALWSSKVPTINFCSPLKLFEYMAAGRVIVAHAFPTIQEVLTDEKEAVLCQPDDPSSVETGLKRALSLSGNNQLGLNARRKAFRQYSWDTRVLKLLTFLENKIQANNT
jgi:glycosyltransferase involved in cell wall biosynthesis